MVRHPAILASLLTIAAGCGGSNGGSGTPNAPTPTPANRSPTITSVAVNPAAGISTLTTHSFSVVANDPDGDALTYTWDFGNDTGSNAASATVTYNNANTRTYQATVTVRDSKGATATGNVSVTSATIAGSFAGFLQNIRVTAQLTQYLGGLVNGSWQFPDLGITGEVGPSGEPGKIHADGQFELRFKVRVGSFDDFYYRGSMDPTGQRLTGTLQGSGFSGQYMQLERQ